MGLYDDRLFVLIISSAGILEKGPNCPLARRIASADHQNRIISRPTRSWLTYRQMFLLFPLYITPPCYDDLKDHSRFLVLCDPIL